MKKISTATARRIEKVLSRGISKSSRLLCPVLPEAAEQRKKEDCPTKSVGKLQ